MAAAADMAVVEGAECILAAEAVGCISEAVGCISEAAACVLEAAACISVACVWVAAISAAFALAAAGSIPAHCRGKQSTPHCRGKQSTPQTARCRMDAR